MAEDTEPNSGLKGVLRDWGRYVAKENCIYLFDNAFLKDPKLIQVLKDHKIKIQLDLFT